MEQIPDCIYFAPEMEFMIGKTRFIVSAQYDEKQESLPEKLARLLKKAVGSTLDKSVNL